MDILNKLIKVPICKRQICVCGNRVKELLIHIPLNTEEELKNEYKISEANRQLKICKNKYEYMQLIKDPKAM